MSKRTLIYKDAHIILQQVTNLAPGRIDLEIV